MLTKREVLKMEKKLAQNRMDKKSPKSKNELCKMLGFSRQLLYYISYTENVNNSKPAEEKVREWLNE